MDLGKQISRSQFYWFLLFLVSFMKFHYSVDFIGFQINMNIKVLKDIDSTVWLNKTKSLYKKYFFKTND